MESRSIIFFFIAQQQGTCEMLSLLGFASLRQGVISELVDGGSYEKRCYLEDGPSLYFVVYLKGAK
jgi:hypothetical protein